MIKPASDLDNDSNITSVILMQALRKSSLDSKSYSL